MATDLAEFIGGAIGLASLVHVSLLTGMVATGIVTAPSFAIVAGGIDPMCDLVLSQVVLSFVLPVPMIALVLLIQRPSVMGDFVNSRPTTYLASAATAAIIGLNLILVFDTFGSI